MAVTLTANLGLDKPAVSDTGWGTLRNTNMDDLDSEIVRPRILQSALSWGATTTVDLSLARVFTGTNSQVSTIAFSNVPSSFPNGAVVPVVRCDLIITNGGAFAITWPASVVWLSGVAPTLKTSGVDIITLVTRDGGTTWYAGALDRPYSRLIGQATTDVGTGAVTTEVTLHSVAVPANTLGPNGGVRIRCHYTVAGTNNTKTVRIKFGAHNLFNFPYAAADQLEGIAEFIVTNRNATNSQFSNGFYSTATETITGSGAQTASAVDTTSAVNVVITGQTANAADEVTANVTLVELMRS